MKDQYVLKICILGSYHTTSLKKQVVKALTSEDPPIGHMSTIGVDVTSKTLKINNQEAKLILHNTAGEEYLGKLRGFYYEGSVAGVIVFDKGCRDSFASIPDHIQEYRKGWRDKSPMVLLGIITDLEEISFDEGQQVATELNCLYFESSPSDNRKISDVFIKLTQLAID